MLIDCDTCVMRDRACHDCAVSFLLTPQRFSDAETEALAVLAGSGLLPPLRMVPAVGAERVAGARPGPGPAARHRPGGGPAGTRGPGQRGEAAAG